MIFTASIEFFFWLPGPQPIAAEGRLEVLGGARRFSGRMTKYACPKHPPLTTTCVLQRIWCCEKKTLQNLHHMKECTKFSSVKIKTLAQKVRSWSDLEPFFFFEYHFFDKNVTENV